LFDATAVELIGRVRTYLLAAAISALAIGSTHAEAPQVIELPPVVRFGCLDIADTERIERLPEAKDDTAVRGILDSGRCAFFVPRLPERGGTADDWVYYEDCIRPDGEDGCLTHAETPRVIVKSGQLLRFGCLDIADTERIERLREAKDDTAVRGILDSGRCAFFVPLLPERGGTADDRVYYEDETRGEFGCIRPDGDDGCYWMRKAYYELFARS